MSPPTTTAETGSSPPSANWLNIAAAAERLRLSERQLYRLVSKRLVPFRRPPGTSAIRFAPADIAEIEAASLVRPIEDGAR